MESSLEARGMAQGATLMERTCRGEPGSRPPIWIMRQAGRYLPEYRALRKTIGFQEATRTPDVAATITLQPMERFKLDAAILFSDIATPLEGMGIELTYEPGPVMAEPLRSRGQIEAMRSLDPQEGVAHVLETIKIVSNELTKDTALIGFAGAPWTLFCYLVQGSGSKDFVAARSLLYGDPALARLLLEKLADSMAKYLVAQARAGAQVLMLFDSWAGLLTPALFTSLIGPVVQIVLDRVRAEVSVPVIYFARGGAAYLDQVGALGADVVGIDWTLPLSQAVDRLGPSSVVQGNLDPSALFAENSVLSQEVYSVLDGGALAKGHIFNLGHGIDRHTNPDRVTAVIEAVHAWSEVRGR